jgi:hypothetical protein
MYQMIVYKLEVLFSWGGGGNVRFLVRLLKSKINKIYEIETFVIFL